MRKESESTFSTVEHLERLYSQNCPKLSFSASSVEEWQKWKENLKGKLIELLGLFPERCDLKPHIVQKKDLGTYYREKIIIQPERGLLMPTYLLIPKRIDLPAPAILALHGHGRGTKDVLGIAESPTWQRFIEGYNYDYAHKLAEKGFITFVPEARGFGEREKESEKVINPREEEDYPTSCRKSSFNAMLLGQSLVGKKVWDVMRSIDYLETRPEINSEKIGCMGLSMGGTITLYTTPLEDRIKVAVISGYLNTFRHSIMAMEHCECNYVPNILKYAEMYDICSLIAPRPLLIEMAKSDPIIPFSSAKLAFNKVKRVYKLLNQEEKLEYDAFEGGHRFSGKKVFDWFTRWLC